MKRQCFENDQDHSSDYQTTTSTESLFSCSSDDTSNAENDSLCQPIFEDGSDWSYLSHQKPTNPSPELFRDSNLIVFNYVKLFNEETQLETSHGKFRFHQRLGNGTHGQVFVSDIPRCNSLFLVVKKFTEGFDEDDDDDDEEEKKENCLYALKELYFFHKLGHISLLYTDKEDYWFIKQALHLQYNHTNDILPFIFEKKTDIDCPHLITPYLGMNFMDTLLRYTASIKQQYPTPEMQLYNRLEKVAILSLTEIILKVIGDLHTRSIIHYDAKALNFVFFLNISGHLSCRPVDFTYSIDLRDHSDIFSKPMTIPLSCRKYLSRVTTRGDASSLICEFIDFYALFMSMIATCTLAPPLKDWFREQSTCQIIELIDQKAYESNYDPNNFWVCAMRILTVHDLQACIGIEYTILKLSPAASNSSAGVFSSLLFWLLALVVNRKMHRRIETSIDCDAKSICFRVTKKSANTDRHTLPENNITEYLSLNNRHPGIFNLLPIEVYFDRIQATHETLVILGCN
ncbi:MAG: hypothetical protein CL816_04835 [Coxiellaceae bacterium]|nr:hypothetical protein [Coxiellaceae bacterium]|tara:strand:- start:1909 stop:3453 length:1545 start_codon:yes stop_codon:yes gene_type:complete